MDLNCGLVLDVVNTLYFDAYMVKHVDEGVELYKGVDKKADKAVMMTGGVAVGGQEARKQKRAVLPTANCTSSSSELNNLSDGQLIVNEPSFASGHPSWHVIVSVASRGDCD